MVVGYTRVSTAEQGDSGGIIVAKLDRLSRSLVDFAGLMARAQAGGWNVVALDLGIDLATPAGEFMANVLPSRRPRVHVFGYFPINSDRHSP